MIGNVKQLESGGHHHLLFTAEASPNMFWPGQSQGFQTRGVQREIYVKQGKQSVSLVAGQEPRQRSRLFMMAFALLYSHLSVCLSFYLPT